MMVLLLCVRDREKRKSADGGKEENLGTRNNIEERWKKERKRRVMKRSCGRCIKNEKREDREKIGFNTQ